MYLPLLMLATAFFGPLTAADALAPACRDCAACSRAEPVSDTASVATPAWFIGPKGGDVRKGVSTARASSPMSSTTPVAAATGPKGGDVRKGATASPPTSFSPAKNMVCRHHVDPTVGPKGGSTDHKGLLGIEQRQKADAACFTACSTQTSVLR